MQKDTAESARDEGHRVPVVQEEVARFFQLLENAVARGNVRRSVVEELVEQADGVLERSDVCNQVERVFFHLIDKRCFEVVQVVAELLVARLPLGLDLSAEHTADEAENELVDRIFDRAHNL